MQTNHSVRLPVLLWGDLVKGDAPILRRALAGERAHECMYAWVYLTEFLAIERLRAKLPELEELDQANIFRGLQGAVWARADRSRIDPYYQLSQLSFDFVAIMTMLAEAAGSIKPQMVELGSTFFASKLRFEIVNTAARALFDDWKQMEPHWVGIDNSMFMHDTTRLLHNDKAVELVTDCNDVPQTDQFNGLISRFVASYVFPDAGKFVEFATGRFDAVMIEDAYSTTRDDVSVYNHGQPETFYALPAVFSAFARKGYTIYVLYSYPDYPGGSAPCHVVKYLAVRNALAKSDFVSRLARLGFELPGATEHPERALDEMNARVSVQRWANVKQAKLESPVWGPTPEDYTAPEPRPFDNLKKPIEGLISRLSPRGDWTDYALGGPQAEREIARALAEEMK